MRPFLKGVSLSGFLYLIACQSFAQTATVVNNGNDPRHETLTQRTISVLFDDGAGGPVTLTGSTAAANWDVKINGTSVSVNSAVILSNRVNVTFDASAVNGVSYLLPGQALTISLTNPGTLLTTGSGNPATDFTDVPSNNNFNFTCTELIFFKQEAYASVDVCSPVVMNFYQYAYKLSLRYRNSANFDINDFDFNVIWGDGNNTIEAPYLSDPAGVANGAYFDNTGFTGSNPAVLLTARPVHNYPAANPTDCSFNFSLVPSVGGLICNSISTTTLFATYDNDNANSGVLSLQPDVPGTDRVCLGSNVNMLFSDQTQLNCRAAIEPILPNDQTRHIRIVYGSNNFDAPAIPGPINNIPDIRVGGVPVTNNDADGSLIFPAGYYPTGGGGIGVPDFNGVIELPSPVTASTATAYMQQITTTLTNNQLEFQRFYVRIDYWDVCNPYDPSDPDVNVVSIENYIEIISTPATPTVATVPRCETEVDANFELTAIGAAGTYDWYADAALLVNLQTAADNTFNPVTEGPVGNRITKTVGASTVFHRYVTVTTANGCTSLPRDVSIQIDDTNNGGTIGHPLGVSPITICTGTNPAVFTSVADATGGDGVYTYQWQVSTTSAVAGFADIGGATASTFDPGVINVPTWFRRRVSSGACADVFSNVIQFSTYVPTATVTGGGSVCSGTPATDIVWTLTGVGQFDFTIDVNPGVDIVVTNHPSGTFTIDDPAPGVNTTYQMILLNDDNGCPATSMGGQVQVTVQAIAPPSVDAGGFTATAAVCDDGVTTNPPDAILDLLPNSAETYNISYKLRNLSTFVETNYNVIANSDANGIVTISPTYADMGNVPLAAGYQIIITGIFNTVTLCSGAVPINGPTLIVNPRPSTATGAIHAAACAAPGNGVALRVADPDPTNTLNLEIAWSTNGPAGALFAAVSTPADGSVSGANNITFTPATSTTATYYAFVTNAATGCLSNTGLAVTQAQENMPTGNAGPDQFGICIDNPSATLASASSGGVGSWSVPGVIAYYQNFEGFANGTASTTAANGWSIDTTQPNSFPQSPVGGAYFEVGTIGGNKAFDGNNLNGNSGGATEVNWQSPVIDITGMTSVQASVDLFESEAAATNNLEAADYIRVFYRLNGGAEVQFATNGNMSNDFTAVTATAFGAPITGSTLQIIVRVSTNDPNERIAFDNVVIKNSTSNITFSNPNATNAVVSNLPVPAGAAPVTTTLRWTVASPLGACVLLDDVDVTVNVLPTSVAITPVLCDEVAGSPVQVTVDLGAYNASVTNGTTVEWFNNALRTPPFLIGAPLAISTGQTYYWRSTNGAGCTNIGQVTFTVEGLPQATDQAYEFCEDVANNIDLTAFEIDITSGAANIEWFEDDGAGGLGAPIDNPGTPLLNEETTYSITATKTVYARVTNLASAAVPQCDNVASVLLTFKPRPVPNVISGDNTLCIGSAVKVYQINPTTNMYGTVHEYLWTLNGTATFDIFSSGSGFASTNSYSGTNDDFILIARFPNAGTFVLTVTEIIDGCSGDVATFNISVSGTPPALSFQSPDLDVCKNETVGYSLTTTNSSTYNWTVIGGNINGATNGVGLTNVSVTWGTSTLPQPSIMVQETNTSGCPGTPASANVTIQDIPVMTQNLDKIVCHGESSGIVFSTTGSSAVASAYNITSIVVDPGLVTTSNLNPRSVGNVNEVANDQFQNTTNDPLDVRYSITPISAANCSGASEEIVLTVEPQVTSNITNTTPSICSSASVQISLQSPTNPSAGDISFNYTATASSGLISGFQPVQNNLPTGTVINHNVNNNDNQPQTLTYSIVPIAQNAKLGNGCQGAPVNIVVSIEPKPKLVITPNTAAVCEEVPLAFTLTSTTMPSIGNVVFQVTGNPIATGGVTGASPDASLFTNGDLLDDVLVNPTVTAQTILYRLTPMAPGVNCAGDYAEVTVTVNPKPIVTPATTLQAICSGSNINIALEFDVPNSTSTWTVAADANVIGATAGAGKNVFQSLFNTSFAGAQAVYTVTPLSPAGCLGNAETITITVDPSPTGTATPATKTICTGETTGVQLTSEVVGTTFSWTSTASSTLITGASGGSGSEIDQTLDNTSFFPGTVIYRITPSGPGPTFCAGNPTTTIITVAPVVDGRFLSNDAAICSGSSEFVTMFFDGQAPFTVTYNDGSADTTLNNVGNFDLEQFSPSATTTYSITSVTDVNGCTVSIDDEQLTITVSEADAEFSVLTSTTCSPSTTSFQYQQVSGVVYTWRWFDGSPDSTYTASASSAAATVAHRFTNPSPTATMDFPVSLTARVAQELGNCIDMETETVSVYPRVVPNVFPNKMVICSGETVDFSNQAFGASAHRWYYREVGSAQEQDIRASSDVSYTLINTTTQNPIIYEVVYVGGNGNCPGEKVTPITVYRGATGVINAGTIPPFTGGQTTVTFTNDSSPLDGTDFKYDWEFGANGEPTIFSGANATIPVTYSSPGSKRVVLRITNLDAQQCVTSVEKVITILLPPLVAAFNVNPFFSCYPADITVTENTSTGDVFRWQVIERNGTVAATALSPKPTFRINAPGIYDVILETQNSITGQTAIGRVDGIEIFERPKAIFEVRPEIVFVPDGEVVIFNRSTDASFYEWDFGDGSTPQFEPEPKHTYQTVGTYTITLIAGFEHEGLDFDRNGDPDGNLVCVDSVSTEVKAQEGGRAKVPNAFTPGLNGPSNGTPGSGTVNDVFLPITKGVEDFHMQIYDRWGNLIFESKDKSMGWDGYDKNGILMPAGVYVFKLDLRLSDGNQMTQIGDVTLIR